MGYEKAAEIARKVYLENKSIFEIALGMHVMDGKKLKRVLDPERFI